MKKIIFLVVILCLALPLACASAAAPVIEGQPADCNILEGAECSFRVSHGAAASFLWRFVDPASGTAIQASKAPESFPGLEVSGDTTDTLVLKHVPLDLDGWGVFCRLSNGSDYTDTRLAMLTVRYNVGGANTVNAPTAAAAPTAKPAPAVRIVNGYLQMADSNGTPTGEKKSQIPLSGSMDVAATANAKTVHSWIINGVKYDFEDNVTRIVFRRVTEALVVEPVVDSNPQTLKSAQDVQAARTGQVLLVKTINARMHFLDASGKNIGGKSFREFDFTNDYTNTATNQIEKGGQISGRVTGEAPSGYKIYGWRFNNMRLTFNGEVTFFLVHGLDVSMEYEPLLVNNSYTVNCYGGCSFSGGGYNHATSGSVPAGTQITVHTAPGTAGYYTGSLTLGSVDNTINWDVGYTVNSDSWITFNHVIN